MSLERLEAQDGRDTLEFVNVGLSSGEATLLLRRSFREAGLTPAGDFETQRALVAEAWLMGATAARFALQGHDVCHVCGCSHLRACPGGCSWTAPNLCSACDPGRFLCEALPNG